MLYMNNIIAEKEAGDREQFNESSNILNFFKIQHNLQIGVRSWVVYGGHGDICLWCHGQLWDGWGKTKNEELFKVRCLCGVTLNTCQNFKMDSDVTLLGGAFGKRKPSPVIVCRSYFLHLFTVGEEMIQLSMERSLQRSDMGE